MWSRSLLTSLEAAGMVTWPAAMLFYAVIVDEKRHPLTGTRRNVFRAATAAGIAAAVLMVADITRYDLTREKVNVFWAVSNFAAIFLWLFGLAGAFWGKSNGRVLLILAQCATALAALLLMSRIVTE